MAVRRGGGRISVTEECVYLCPLIQMRMRLLEPRCVLRSMNTMSGMRTIIMRVIAHDS